MILPRLELETYFYQKYTLPIKLKNLTRALRFELRSERLKLYILPLNYALRKRGESNTQVYNTIFSKYLTLPIATFPRTKSDLNRYFLSRQDNALPIKLLVLEASRI